MSAVTDTQKEIKYNPTKKPGISNLLTIYSLFSQREIKDIEREFINSGKVKFVATSEERKEVRDERLEQQSYASDETAKRLAAETGADFMLKGSIKTHIDAIEGKQIKFYQVDMELINVETNEKVWMDSKKIKKFVKQKKAKW